MSTATIAKSARTRGQVEPLSDAVSHILEECRMVLPGIQALFGFQLIAVFNQTFWDKLQPHEQVIHFAAIYLVALSVALVMAPAAYHRLAEPTQISRRFIAVSTFFLSTSMYPLMVAISMDLYLIANLVFESWAGSLLLTALLLSIFTTLWVVFPRMTALQKLLDR